MLIRVIVKNLFSFKDYTEFNTLPGRFSRLPRHIMNSGGTNLLKVSAIYGANGAGKSNFIRVIDILQDFLVSGNMPMELVTETFKFDKWGKDKDVYIGVEFTKNDISYYYDITINQGIVIQEELLINGPGDADDKILFNRTDGGNKENLTLEFSPEVQNDKEASLFPGFLKNEILERNKLVLHYMKNRQSPVFEPYKGAIQWFEDDLVLILPDRKPGALALRLEKDSSFFEFANRTIQASGTGISDIHVVTTPIEDFFGKNDRAVAERITTELRARPGMNQYVRNGLEEIVFTLQNDRAYAKEIRFSHFEDQGEAKFQYNEESDGTRRLMDYLPALYSIVNTDETYVIDEMERSLHPVLVKDLLKKFSRDPNTKGQLIFSTHESNLLDQDIFRPDEIWFAEKTKEGATEFYPLSEFKEHHTIDIRKGYLNGRYGAIPFLGNLVDLNWEKHA